MAILNIANIFTKTITASTFVIPQGAIEVFIENIGSGDASWEGNLTGMPNDTNNTTQSAVTLSKGKSFAYGYVGKGRAGFTIDATATIVQVSITF